MGDWYWIGMVGGLGVAIGVLFGGLLARSVATAVLAVLLAAGAGLAAGLGIGEWDEAIAGAVGGVLGAAGAIPFARGSLRAGGTTGGTAAVMTMAASFVGALALIPGIGYFLAVAVPALGLRLRTRAPKRYAGLRTLAK